MNESDKAIWESAGGARSLAGGESLTLKRQLSLGYLSSPARPLGAFSFSGGLSSFIEEGIVKDGDSLLSYLRDLIALGLSRTDLPILARSFAAALNKDSEALLRLGELSLALRETKELCLEEREMGRAVMRLMEAGGLLKGFPEFTGKSPLGYVASYGLLGASLGLIREDAPFLLSSYLWAYAENLSTAASKSVPLGQTETQRVLLSLMDEIPSYVWESMKVQDDDIGSSLPMLSIMSSRHEESPLRMYRS
jgi:urease accessory protein